MPYCYASKVIQQQLLLELLLLLLLLLLTCIEVKDLCDVTEPLAGVWIEASNGEDVSIGVGIESKHSLGWNVRKAAPARRLKVIHLECCYWQLALTSTYNDNYYYNCDYYNYTTPNATSTTTTTTTTILLLLPILLHNETSESHTLQTP